MKTKEENKEVQEILQKISVVLGVEVTKEMLEKDYNYLTTKKVSNK